MTGTAITLTAAAQGGIASGNVEYKFVAEYQLADGTWATPMLLRDYATNPMYTWTPSDPLIYTLVVYARVVGSTQPYDVYGYINYAIQPANLTGVTLTASPRAPQPTGTAITLTAAAQGGIAPANVEYKFVVGIPAGEWHLVAPDPAARLCDEPAVPLDADACRELHRGGLCAHSGEYGSVQCVRLHHLPGEINFLLLRPAPTPARFFKQEQEQEVGAGSYLSQSGGQQHSLEGNSTVWKGAAAPLGSSPLGAQASRPIPFK